MCQRGVKSQASTKSAGCTVDAHALSLCCRHVYFRLLVASGRFPPPGPFLAFFVLAFFGGLGGWAVFPVPLTFPGFRQLCWNLACDVVPVLLLYAARACNIYRDKPVGQRF